LLLFTDGVNESLDARGNPFGMKGIEDALRPVGRAAPQALVDALVRSVKQHAAGRDPFDDMTVVALGRTA